MTPSRGAAALMGVETSMGSPQVPQPFTGAVTTGSPANLVNVGWLAMGLPLIGLILGGLAFLQIALDQGSGLIVLLGMLDKIILST